MKIELCNFSGFKIYPGKGISFVRADGRSHRFANKKCEHSYQLKRNPRKTDWTVVYRRLHKKGIVEETKRRKSRKRQTVQRAIVGASLDVLRAKRAQKPEVRQANREAALRKAKEEKKAKKAAKKELKKAAPKATGAKGKNKGGKPKGGR